MPAEGLDVSLMTCEIQCGHDMTFNGEGFNVMTCEIQCGHDMT